MAARFTRFLPSRSTVVAVAAMVLSAAAHFGAYEAVHNLVIPFVRGVEPGTKPKPEDDTPPETRVDVYSETDAATADPLKAADPLGDGPEMPADLMEQSIPKAIFDPPPAPKLPPPAASLPAPPPDEKLALPAPRDLPAPDILVITDARARDLSAPIERREIPDVERILLSPDLSLSLPTNVPLASVDVTAAIASVPAPHLDAAREAATLLPAPVPSLGARSLAETIPDVGPVAQGTVVTDIRPEKHEEITGDTPLDDRLALRTWATRPASDPNHVYFRIDVAPRDDAALPDIPRDIVFVQDTSASLTSQRLDPSRIAIRNALRALRPGDRFNICAFAATNRFLAPGTWLAPDSDSIARADAFLASLESKGNTDLFRSMQDILDLPRAPHRAPIAIVLTDGHITAGALERDSAVIGAFSRLNAGAVSVFTIGLHRSANAYLLDMLSFCDRGGNTAIAPERFDIPKTIRSVVDSIGQPVLANVRFGFGTKSGAEAYPSLSPNLYRGRPLRLYGRVPADRDSIAFFARGDACGDPYDMVFEIDLSQAAPGPSDLPVEWATQRMYDLVARHARSEDPSLVEEMLRLGAQFGIPVPHARRIGVTQP